MKKKWEDGFYKQNNRKWAGFYEQNNNRIYVKILLINSLNEYADLLKYRGRQLHMIIWSTSIEQF